MIAELIMTRSETRSTL